MFGRMLDDVHGLDESCWTQSRSADWGGKKVFPASLFTKNLTPKAVEDAWDEALKVMKKKTDRYGAARSFDCFIAFHGNADLAKAFCSLGRPHSLSGPNNYSNHVRALGHPIGVACLADNVDTMEIFFNKLDEKSKLEFSGEFARQCLFLCQLSKSKRCEAWLNSRGHTTLPGTVVSKDVPVHGLWWIEKENANHSLKEITSRELLKKIREQQSLDVLEGQSSDVVETCFSLLNPSNDFFTIHRIVMASTVQHLMPPRVVAASIAWFKFAVNELNLCDFAFPGALMSPFEPPIKVQNVWNTWEGCEVFSGPDAAALHAPVIPTKAEFLKQFSLFSKGIFDKGFNFKNVCIAGGAVAGSFDFANSSLYATSDIDMFLFGFSEHLDYVKKAEEIQTYFEKHFGPILTLRNSNNFVFVLPFPYRRVSVALGQWASAADILREADIDVCGMGITEDGVFCTEACRAALTYRWNVLSYESGAVRGAPVYERRLAKYAKRGFAVVSCLKPDVLPGYLYGKELFLKELNGKANITLNELPKCTEKIDLSELKAKVLEQGYVEGDNYGNEESGFEVIEDAENFRSAYFRTCHDRSDMAEMMEFVW